MSASKSAVTLTGRHVQLVPLTMTHLDALLDVAVDPAIWQFSGSMIETRQDMRAYIQEALDARDAGQAVPFATIDRASGRPVGSTRFGNIEPAHRRVEIGWTWLAPEWQRTALNTEAKLLMLTHAFESMGCVRVELKTDSQNMKSQAAMRRIGAVEEGTLRKHMITPAGRRRDSVYFSILDDEWPDVKAGLLERLARRS